MKHMDESTFSAVMTALHYEDHITSQFNRIISMQEGEERQSNARKTSLILLLQGQPYWKVGQVYEK